MKAFLLRHPTVTAAMSFLAVLGLLFHRLATGEVLSPSANIWTDVPFHGELREDFSRYLNGVQGDVWREFEPWHIYQYRSAREGRFPLWNPHIFTGFPVHANGQSAMLSPFHWLYFAVDPKWAGGIVAALKLWTAGFATFCLACRLGITWSGAFIAGLSWMLSGFMVRWLLWNHSATAALLPVMLLASELIIERVSLRRFALAGLVATALQLSGHPESQFHVGALTGLYVLVRVALCNLSLAERSVRILLCAGAQIVGLLGAAVSIVPLAEQLRESADWHESTHALERHLPLAGLIGVIAPDHFGRPRAGRFYYGPLNYNEAGLYVGLAPLALALTEFFALLYQPRRTRRGAAGAASVIFAVWLVLCSAIVFGVPGTATFLRHVPLFSKADNLRLILGLQFSLAMLSGIAWAHLTENLGRFRAVSLTVICVAITILLGTLMFVQGSTDLYSHIEGIRKLWTDATVPAPWEHRSLRTLMSVLVAALVTLWSVWHWLHARRARWSSGGSTSLGTSRPARPDRHSFELPSKLLVGCLIAITVGDLCWVAYDFTPIVPSRVVFPNAPESLRRIADNLRGGRLAATDEILSPNLAMVYGLRDFRGYDFPLDRNWTMLFRKLGWKSGITLCPRDQLFPCIPPVLQSVADKCCIRFFFTAANSKTEPAPAVLPVCDLVDEINDLQPWILVTRGIGPALDLVYQNPTAYPRAYFARRVLVTDPETALDAMLNVSHDLRQQSFVEHQIEDISGAADQSGTATIERDAAEEVWVRTESSSPALLVLSDRYDPNWQVEIDGSPATMLRTNYLFRGVVVPAGEHLVRWSYRPASFRFGRAVSAMTVCALVGLLFVPSRRSVS